MMEIGFCAVRKERADPRQHRLEMVIWQMWRGLGLADGAET
jgi:hypothetical protein